MRFYYIMYILKKQETMLQQTQTNEGVEDGDEKKEVNEVSMDAASITIASESTSIDIGAESAVTTDGGNGEEEEDKEGEKLEKQQKQPSMDDIEAEASIDQIVNEDELLKKILNRTFSSQPNLHSPIAPPDLDSVAASPFLAAQLNSDTRIMLNFQVQQNGGLDKCIIKASNYDDEDDDEIQTLNQSQERQSQETLSTRFILKKQKMCFFQL